MASGSALTTTNHPSIHPSIGLSGVGPRGSKLSMLFQISLSPVFQLLLEDSEVFPGQMRYVIPPTSSGSTPRVSFELDMPGKTSKGGRPEGILNRCANHLSWLPSTQRSSCSPPTSLRRSELFTQSLRLSLKLIRAACKKKLCLLAVLPLHHKGSVQYPHYRNALRQTYIFH